MTESKPCPIELKPCPFCGGEGKISAKEHRFGGYNYLGIPRKQYLVRVICKKCKSRGEPINTGWVHCSYRERNSIFTGDGDRDVFKNVEERAIEAWNRRLNETN